ncbi:MAG: transcription termination factor Rho [Opitutae bacterium]|nr:transcription termination factor Rho [Opitutae bacterium]
MDLPPKTDSDDTASSSDDAAEGSAVKKGTRARRGPVRKAKPAKKTAATKAAAPREETPELFSAPEAPAAAEPREVAPPPAPEPVKVFVPTPPPPAPEPVRPVERAPEPVASAPSEAPAVKDTPAASSAGVESEPAAPADRGNDNEAAASAQEGPAQSHPQQQQGGKPFIKDRNYWKNLKKEKKKWKQQRGGGGGGGGGQDRPSQFPPQPPPPVFAPVFGDLPDPSKFNDLAALDARAAELSGSAQGEPIFLDQFYSLNMADLVAFARQLGVSINGAPPPRKQIIQQIFAAAAAAKRPLRDRGLLDLTDRGYGFIVHKGVQYRLYPEDAYLPESLVKRYGLKRGHELEVLLQAPQGQERCPSVVRVERAMGLPPEEIAKITPFEELTPYYPLRRILVEAPEVHAKEVSMRAVDILTPIGFGQRGLIVSPPRTGKTVLLHNIANSITANYPEAILIILLVDERPEEVTDFKRHTKGEIVASTFDEMPESHVHAAEMVSEKAKRLVEMGQHVVILLDSITRLGRAYNALASNSGKIMSGGIEATALQKPKRFFGAARNIEGGGSLTVLGTALIDTGSRMDEVIFEEFKGTGNMELHLDRGLSDKRIFPAINIDRSGTRKEELIYHPEEMQRIYSLRRAMQGLGPIESMDMLIQRLKKTRTNAEFLLGLSRT